MADDSRRRRQIKRVVVRACVLCAVVALTLAAIELGAFAVLRRSSAAPASRLFADYRAEPWAPAFWRETDRSARYLYQPYVVWRRAPFAGETITVDADGLRRTQGSRCDGSTYTIYMFGGSTLWGTGAPDWATIPSFLARRYREDGRPVCARNYGESAWVTTQEVIKLMLELKRGARVPDLVVFYDGASEVFATFQSGRPDVHQNFDRIKSHFESRREILAGSFGYLLATNAAQLVQQATTRPGATGRGDRDLEALARASVASYLENVALVDVLAQHYGFAYAFFWQPVLFAGRKPLTADEERLRSAERWHDLRALTVATYDLVRREDRRHLHYLADAYREHSGKLYVDIAHVVPEGNRLVADRMYDVLRSIGR